MRKKEKRKKKENKRKRRRKKKNLAKNLGYLVLWQVATESSYDRSPSAQITSLTTRADQVGDHSHLPGLGKHGDLGFHGIHPLQFVGKDV